MITHLVFFKMLQEAENASAEENRENLIALLNQLPSKIPELVELEVGTDFSRSPASFDIGLITRFRTREDLETYRVHPEHLKVVEVIKKITSERAVVDFE